MSRRIKIDALVGVHATKKNRQVKRFGLPEGIVKKYPPGNICWW
jgi:hypothetical protein